MSTTLGCIGHRFTTKPNWGCIGKFTNTEQNTPLEGERMPVAVCIGGPPELIFSAISPLPDNLSEYQFAGILGRKSLPITKALTQDLWVPAEADIIIEGYCDPTETKLEGPFGDHYGFYSLTGQYPVLHVTAITCRKDAVLLRPSLVCRRWRTVTSARRLAVSFPRSSIPTSRCQERSPAP